MTKTASDGGRGQDGIATMSEIGDGKNGEMILYQTADGLVRLVTALRQPAEILGEIRALDAESEKIMKAIGALI